MYFVLLKYKFNKRFVEELKEFMKLGKNFVGRFMKFFLMIKIVYYNILKLVIV